MSVNEHTPPWPGMGVAIVSGDRNCEYTVNGVTAHPGYLEQEPVPGHCAGQQLGHWLPSPCSTSSGHTSTAGGSQYCCMDRK